MELYQHSRILIINKKDKFIFRFILCKDVSARSKAITELSNIGACVKFHLFRGSRLPV